MRKETGIPGCVEMTGEWFGVKLPRSVRFFDCRMPEGSEGIKLYSVTYFDSQKGQQVTYQPTLWSSERADYACGLKGPDDDHGTCPESVSAYTDFRTCNEKEIVKAIKEMRSMVAKAWREWRKAKRYPSTNGGGCYYKPVHVTLCNYGYGIHCDRRTQRVMAFGAPL